jgi:molybdopterin-guanine dinucleotide biosynthesis protein A
MAHATHPTVAHAAGRSTNVSGILLAGGRSTRFGSDKLAALLDGRPLLDHAALALVAVAAELIVVGPATGPLPHGPAGARLVRDAEPHQGPLAALHAGALAAHGDLLLVAGGDMPWLVPDVLRLLIGGVGSAPGRPGAEAALLATSAHQGLRPLPAALTRAAVLAHAPDVLARGERSLRGLIAHLDTALIPEAAWRVHDPEGRSLRDVDRPQDLPSPSRRQTEHAPTP